MRQQDKITHIAINCQVLNHRLTDAIADNYFKQKLKNISKSFLTELVNVEKEYYDKFFLKEEDSTVVVYETYDAFMKTVSTIPIYEMINMMRIWEAYKKDPKSLEGIVNKVLRND